MANKDERTVMQVVLHGKAHGFNRFGDLIHEHNGLRRVIASMRPASVVRFMDDFLGDLITDELSTLKGSDGGAAVAVINSQNNGVVRLVTGAGAGATYAVNGVQLDQGALNFRANEGGLYFETRVLLSAITNVALFVGFTDQFALEMPILGAGGGNGITTNATDAVGILFDTAMTNAVLYGVGVKNDVDAAVLALAGPTTAPTAGAFIQLAVGVDQDENASFWINGRKVGEIKLAVTKTIQLTPVVAAFSRGAASRNVDIDYIAADKNRV